MTKLISAIGCVSVIAIAAVFIYNAGSPTDKTAGQTVAAANESCDCGQCDEGCGCCSGGECNCENCVCTKCDSGSCAACTTDKCCGSCSDTKMVAASAKPDCCGKEGGCAEGNCAKEATEMTSTSACCDKECCKETCCGDADCCEKCNSGS